MFIIIITFAIIIVTITSSSSVGLLYSWSQEVGYSRIAIRLLLVLLQAVEEAGDG